MKDERLVSKMEGETNFARDVKQFDGLTRPGLKVGPGRQGRRPGTLWFAGLYRVSCLLSCSSKSHKIPPI